MSISAKSAPIVMHTQSRQIDRSVLCMFPLTEPQLPHVLEPPAIAALHVGQVLCMFDCRGWVVWISVARWR